MATGEALALARIVWQYLHVPHEPVPADVIIAAGTNDLRVAEFAAGLFLRGWGNPLVCTGGMAHQNDLLATGWDRTEADMYAEVAEKRGVPSACILREDRSTNTAENIRFARRLLAAKGIAPKSVVWAVKPFMQRRVWATLAVEWPEVKSTIASPRMTLDEYFTPDLPPDKIIHIMMGDLQRVWVYADKGWSAPQEIPPAVHEAYRRLVELGFTRQLI